MKMMLIVQLKLGSFLFLLKKCGKGTHLQEKYWHISMKMAKFGFGKLKYHGKGLGIVKELLL